MAGRFFIIATVSLGVLMIFNFCTYTRIPKCLKQKFGSYTLLSSNNKENIINYGGVYRELKKNTKRQYGGGGYYINHEDTSTSIQNISFFKNGLCYMHDNTRGTYEIIRDTIKTLIIFRSSLMAGESWVFEKWYKIIDKNTIQAVYVRSFSQDCTTSNSNWLDTTNFFPSKYYPTSDPFSRPDDNWLINKKWFWKDKEEYKEWKKHH